MIGSVVHKDAFDGYLPQVPRSPNEIRFLELILTNPTVVEVLDEARQLALPDWYLTAGCLFQTVWNVLDGLPADRGIRDYDLFYFDPTDVSFDGEDAAISRAAERFGDLAVEVRNEARVHLWYEGKFGRFYHPFASCEDAIDHFAATACCVAVRQEEDRSFTIHAPFGFDDLFGFILRPNPRLASRGVYETKATRWAQLWPRLAVLPWPE